MKRRSFTEYVFLALVVWQLSAVVSFGQFLTTKPGTTFKPSVPPRTPAPRFSYPPRPVTPPPVRRAPPRPQQPLSIPRNYEEPPIQLPSQTVQVVETERPINLDCALAKLLQALDNFSAAGVVEIHSKVDGKPDIRSLPFTLSILGEKIRSDIDLRRIDEGLKTDDEFATMRQIGINQLVTVTIPKLSSYTVLVPEMNSYVNHPLPLPDVPGLIRVGSRISGEDKIHGKLYSKFDLDMVYNTGEVVKVEWWANPNTRDQPEFLKFTREESSIIVRFKAYQLGSPPASSFEVPPDYSKYSEMGLLMQARTIARTPLNKVRPITADQTFRARFDNFGGRSSAR
jgi:hypothetical protein